jgi:hypothetical protein
MLSKGALVPRRRQWGAAAPLPWREPGRVTKMATWCSRPLPRSPLVHQFNEQMCGKHFRRPVQLGAAAAQEQGFHDDYGTVHSKRTFITLAVENDA